MYKINIKARRTITDFENDIFIFNFIGGYAFNRNLLDKTLEKLMQFHKLQFKILGLITVDSKSMTPIEIKFTKEILKEYYLDKADIIQLVNQIQEELNLSNNSIYEVSYVEGDFDLSLEQQAINIVKNKIAVNINKISNLRINQEVPSILSDIAFNEIQSYLTQTLKRKSSYNSKGHLIVKTFMENDVPYLTIKPISTLEIKNLQEQNTVLSY